MESSTLGPGLSTFQNEHSSSFDKQNFLFDLNFPQTTSIYNMPTPSPYSSFPSHGGLSGDSFQSTQISTHTIPPASSQETNPDSYSVANVLRHSTLSPNFEVRLRFSFKD